MKNNHSNPIDRDDPRLTAYALGEGTPEDRAEIEAALAADASLAEQVESIRHTANLLTTTLAAEPLPEEPVKVQTKKKWYQKQIAPIVFFTATACLLLALFLPSLVFTVGNVRENAQCKVAPYYLDDSEVACCVAPSEPCIRSLPNGSTSDTKAVELEPLQKEKLKYEKMDRFAKNTASRSEAIAESLQLVEDSFICFDDRQPIVHPDAEVWEKMSERRKQKYAAIGLSKKKQDQPASSYASPSSKLTSTSTPWGYSAKPFRNSLDVSGWERRSANEPYFNQPPSYRDVIVNAAETQTGRLMFGVGVNSDVGLTGNIVLDEQSKESGVAMGKETQSLQMMVNPRIVIQEKEEARIGMTAPGVYSADLDVPFQVLGRKIEEAGQEEGYVVGKRVYETTPARTQRNIIINSLSLQPGDVIDIEKIRESEQRLRASEVFNKNNENPPKVMFAPQKHNTEAYDPIVENEFLRTTDQPLSTFSIDVDTAGYSNLRRFVQQGSLPPKGAVRTEELVNYFEYDYTPPTAEEKTPFAANMAVAACPWNEKHQLVRIALKGREVEEKNRPELNLVFLLDVSGSMSDENKLPLVKEGMTRLVHQLDKHDRVAIVVYAGASGLVLPSTAADEQGKPKILAALDDLESGGSTNGGEGIRLAYATAAQNFNVEGVNRVILCTDGDFNVGTTNESELVELIEKKAKEDVFLTVLGFGCGNYKDSTLEKLADKGNGNYGYIDTLAEAEKLLVRQLQGTLVTIAKDVKIQVEFNPKKVAGYRLLGYENRVMAKEDFNDDTKDAGEIGAGHTVTAFYELIPAGSDEKIGTPAVDPLKYQAEAEAATEEELKEIIEETDPANLELLTLKLRYKAPDGDTSTKVEFPLTVPEKLPAFSEADNDFRFAGSVVALAMLLRDSQYKGTANFNDVIRWAEGAKGADPHGYRKEFIELIRMARSLSNQ